MINNGVLEDPWQKNVRLGVFGENVFEENALLLSQITLDTRLQLLHPAGTPSVALKGLPQVIKLIHQRQRDDRGKSNKKK